MFKPVSIDVEDGTQCLQAFWISPAALVDQVEAIAVFTTAGGRELTLASNFPYEIWLDGQFHGDGGHRCVPGESLVDHWPSSHAARVVEIRSHWMDPLQTEVMYRCLFADPFLASNICLDEWRWRLEKQTTFGSKMSSQLPRQNIIRTHRQAVEATEVPLPPQLSRNWRAIENSLRRAVYREVSPRQLATSIRPGEPGNELTLIPSLNLRDVVIGPDAPILRCDSYDLGYLALHRFEVTTFESPCVLFYSELPRLDEALWGLGRSNVCTADALERSINDGSPFGVRGTRYVHVLYAEDSVHAPAIRVWRRDYPLRWSVVSVSEQDRPIIDACRKTLKACVDGGLTDTCWRERAQWTGDIRASSAAMAVLTDNPEVVRLALSQIAQSYDSSTGMVNAVWPAHWPDTVFQIPQFHLAFCLTALENPEMLNDRSVKHAVFDSFRVWSRRYFRDGLIMGMPGWYFSDWDSLDSDAAPEPNSALLPNAVCNSWWNELSRQLDKQASVCPHAFDQEFWNGTAYSLTRRHEISSPHATAEAIRNVPGIRHYDEGVSYILQQIESGDIRQRVTPYFAVFIGLALKEACGSERAIEFLRWYYTPLANKYGTIPERYSGESSLAHGWSVGVAAALVAESKSSLNLAGQTRTDSDPNSHTIDHIITGRGSR